MNGVGIVGKSILSSALTSGQALSQQALLQGVSPQMIRLSHFGEQLELPYFAISKVAEPEVRLMSYLVQVITEALDDAGIAADLRKTIPVFIGSSSFDIYDSEQQYQQQIAAGESALPLPITSFSSMIDRAMQRLGMCGDVFSFNTACSASANAMLTASKMINGGVYTDALVIGVELFNLTSLSGFSALQLISPSASIKPFSQDRDGLVLGEACSAVVLAASDQTSSFLLGGASNCDTSSISAASSDGSSIAAAIALALAHADVASSDITAIKAHATGTGLNDAAEMMGLRKAFGDNLPPVTCFKPYLGHTLGACGVTELVFLLNGLAEQFLPAVPVPTVKDDRFGVLPLQQALKLEKGVFLLNYFGFGGNNTALVVRHDG